jgi:hypothetical protein
MPTPDRPEKQQPPFHPFKLDEQNSIPFSLIIIMITSNDVSCVQHRNHPVFFYFVELKFRNEISFSCSPRRL